MLRRSKEMGITSKPRRKLSTLLAFRLRLLATLPLSAIFASAVASPLGVPAVDFGSALTLAPVVIVPAVVHGLILAFCSKRTHTTLKSAQWHAGMARVATI